MRGLPVLLPTDAVVGGAWEGTGEGCASESSTDIGESSRSMGPDTIKVAKRS